MAGVIRQGERFTGTAQTGGALTYAPNARSVGPLPGAPAVSTRAQRAPFGLSPSDVSPLRPDEPRSYHIARWDTMADTKKVQIIRKIAMGGGRDPEVRGFAVGILRAAGVEARDYPGQAAALLTWVQQNVYYANEAGEILQDAGYTIRRRLGDCDDAMILLASLYESVGLPWLIVLSGQDAKGQRVQWIEGGRYPGFFSGHAGVEMAHIYLTVYLGGPVPPKDRGFPGAPWPADRSKLSPWAFVEPTLKGAPVGHDVAMLMTLMPEMGAPAPSSALGGFSAYGKDSSQMFGPMHFNFAKEGSAQWLAAEAADAKEDSAWARDRAAWHISDALWIGALAAPVVFGALGAMRSRRAIAAGVGVGVLAAIGLGAVSAYYNGQPTRVDRVLAGYGTFGYPLSVMTTSTAASNASSFAMLKNLNWPYVLSATIVGVATSVMGQIVIDAVHVWMRSGKKTSSRP